MRAFILLALLPVAQALRSSPAVPTETDVQGLRTKLQTLADGLTAMSGSFASTQLGPELKTLLGQLHKVLAETKDMKDHALAMKMLQAARDGMAGLTKELTGRQVELMKQSETEKQSLLLGVLMTHQKDPMPQQFELLKSHDFADLGVAQALLKTHDNTTALITQAATYLDEHGGKAAGETLRKQADQHVQHQKEVEAMAESFEKRVKAMESEYAEKEKRHNARVKELKTGATKTTLSKKSQSVMKSVLKREERSFKKFSVSQKHDIETMKSAAAAMRSGDRKALNRAKDALEQSMKNLQSKNSGFIVLLTLGHQFMERDCPYCAAQCIDKCHAAGNPYTQCMATCADAGK